MASLNKDTFYSLLIKVPVLALNFLSGIILARMLGGTGRGLYQFVTTSTDLAILILGLNLPTALAYFIASNTIDRKQVFGITFSIIISAILLFGLFVGATFLFSEQLLSWFLPKEYQSIFFVAFIGSYFLFMLIQNILVGILQGDRHFNTINLLSLLLRIIPLAIYGFAYYLLYTEQLVLNLEERFGLVLLVQLISLFLYLVLALPKIKPQLSFSFRGAIRPFLDYLSIVYLDMLVFFLNRRSTVWFIEEYSDMSALGDYAMALLLSESVAQLMAVIPLVLMPYLTRMNRQEGIQIFLLFNRISFGAVVLIAVVLAILAPLIIWLCLGDEFMGATVPLQILSIAAIFLIVRSMFANYNYAYKRPKYNLYGDFLGLLAILILSYLLIPTYGIIGASFAALGAYLVSGLYLSINVLLDAKVSFKEAFLLRWADVGRLRERLQ